MSARTRICIYGVRTEDDAMAAAEGGADAIGFLFIPGSTRGVLPDAAWEIVQCLPPFISTVGVFSNASVDQFCSTEEACPTDLSQLHGDENEETVRQCGPRVIKTVKASSPATLAAQVARWQDVDEVDAVLVTNNADSGVTWDQVRLATEPSEKLILIGGGLTMHNVGEAVRIVRPWGVAVRESVEADAGEGQGASIQQHLVEHFCSAVRKADRQ